MPIMRCQVKGTTGYKWGESGKCYTGVNARKKAIAQGRAIKARQLDTFIEDSMESKLSFKALLKGLKATGRLKKPTKKLPKWLSQPRINEVKYWNIIKEILNPFLEIVRSKILINIQRWVEDNKRLSQDGYLKDQIDDWSDEFDEILDEYNELETEIFETDKLSLETDLFLAAGIINAFNLKQFRKIFKKAFGIDYIFPETWQQNISKSWVKDNVNLIKGLTDEYRKKFTNAIYNGMRQGKSWDQIERDLIQINKQIFTGRTETKIIKGRKIRKKIQSRSELIARDQVNKLNAKLTKKRQIDIGIELYIWRTLGDAKVRATHNPLNRKTMRWDDDTVYSNDGGKTWNLRGDIGGFIGIPGEDFQCRCGSDPSPGIELLLSELEEFEEFEEF